MSSRASASTDPQIRVGFIVSTPYQLFHYAAIRRHLDAEVVAYVEIRNADFGVSRAQLETQLGSCRIEWVNSDDLRRIDGECDVLVCQTPIPVLKFFSRSRIVAQQYSLAKERYQYGVWRAQADLNLMYGTYSTRLIEPFARSMATGNPLLDGHLATTGLIEAGAEDPASLRVLYMPTYGDLSDRARVIDALLAQGVSLTVKAHHADFELADLATDRGVAVQTSDTDPIALIRHSDLVVSDYSGAIYDALAMRTPVAVVDVLNTVSESLGRLSADDLSWSNVSGLVAPWRPDREIREARLTSWQALADDGTYRGYLNRFFVNVGEAGRPCADAITGLANSGTGETFGQSQVREAMKSYITQGREVRAELKRVARKANRRTLLSQAKRIRNRLRRLAATALRVTPSGHRVLQHLRTQRAMVPGSTPNGLARASAFSLNPSLRRRQVLTALEQACRASGLEHRVDASIYRTYLAVRQENLDQLHAVLSTLTLGGEPIRFWLGQGARYSTIRTPGTLTLGDLAGTDSVLVGVPHRSGQFLLEENGAAEILILGRRESRLISLRHRAEKMDWTRAFSEPEGPSDNPSTHADEQVDIVYTWVDSADPEWMVEREKWSGDVDFTMDSAANEERYLDREELRYSMRSLSLYAPFVRNVYIVTHGHRPAWLVPDNDKVRIVTHSDIFPDPSVLPTFNSHAIEACLHRIPGLSENFLYFNDDVFLGKDTRFRDFFTQAKLMKSRFSPSSFVAADRPAPDAIPTDWASYNAVTLMRDGFGMNFARKLMHVPHPLKKSLLEELEARYPEVFRVSRASRFRAHADYAIPSMLAHYYGIATRQAVEWDNPPGEYAYLDTGRADFLERVATIFAKRPMFLCLNVTRHTDIDLATQARLVQQTLDELYPVPSPFELQ